MCVSGVVMGRVGGLLLGVLLIGVLVGCGEGLLVEIEPGFVLSFFSLFFFFFSSFCLFLFFLPLTPFFHLH